MKNEQTPQISSLGHQERFYPEDPQKKAAFDAAMEQMPDEALDVMLVERGDNGLPTWQEWIDNSVEADPYSAGVARAAERLAQLLQGEYMSHAEDSPDHTIPDPRLREIENIIADIDGQSGPSIAGAIANARYYTTAGERAYGVYEVKKSKVSFGRKVADRAVSLLGIRRPL